MARHTLQDRNRVLLSKSLLQNVLSAFKSIDLLKSTLFCICKSFQSCKVLVVVVSELLMEVKVTKEQLSGAEEEVGRLLAEEDDRETDKQQLTPRNWKELKHQKTIQCVRECWSVAAQGNLVCVGVRGGILLFSKTSGAYIRELGSDQIESYVYGIAFSDEDTIVVSADWRLRKYTTKGQLVHTFDSGRTRFDPDGLTVGAGGLIFVCDNRNHCVWVFNVDGKLLSSFGSKGSGAGQLNCPRGVCVDASGLLYISDNGNRRICVYSVEGTFIREFPTLRVPRYIAVTACNHLVVNAIFSDTVMILTTCGQLVHEFSREGGGFKCPRGVAVDDGERIYICDSGNRLVEVY